MRSVSVAGVGMTRFDKFPDRNLSSLAEEAVAAALGDAGSEPTAVDGVFFSNGVAGLTTGQEMIRGQVALQRTGLAGRPMFNVEGACASASLAFHLAWMGVASGQYDVAVAVGAEKLTHPDKATTFQAIGTGVDVEAREEALADGAGTDRSAFMDLYAEWTRSYMADSGATAEDFADIVIKSRHNASLNDKAQLRDVPTREQVLASRTISDPLTLMMCSPIGDGAAAAVLMSDDALARARVEQPIRVRASQVVSGLAERGDAPAILPRALAPAYEQAGLGPKDLDLIELHDATAPSELMVYESLGLCEPGGGPEFLRSGASRIDGTTPVNPSGGLLSRGHPIGATGLAQIAEVVDQLRGRAGPRQIDDARVGLIENGGGYINGEAAALAVNILSR